MLPIKLNLPEGFLEEEVRCGYTVTTDCKKLWAVELDLLAEFDRVCKKHGLTYFADGGTLLGAVRHQGFIPWDDDVDVIMYREDYEKLAKVAEQEFQHPYFFQSPYTDPGLVTGGSKLRNSNTTLISDFDHKRPFRNKGIFIDIFILDNLPDSEFQMKIYKRVLKCYWRVLRYASYYDGYFKTDRTNSLKAHVVGRMALALKHIVGIERLSGGYTMCCSRYRNKNTARIGDTESSRGKFQFQKELYNPKDVSCIPFEHIQIPVPNHYNEILSILYGDYMVMKKIAGVHRALRYDAETPYEEYGQMAR